MPKTATKLGINPQTIDTFQSVGPPLLPADSETSQLTLLLKEYFTPADIEQVWAAYRYAAIAHEGQTRRTGEPYISHPVAVACILAKLHLDLPTVMAALLHDVVEDTGVAIAEINQKFGKSEIWLKV
jgi:GTP diphosphokinase / guanosine-3',5'-bis(diphosphate) 3'-diphosphatase